MFPASRPRSAGTIPFMHLVLMLGNLALVLAFAILALSPLKLRSRPAYLIAIYIVAYADIVLVLQIAGVFNALARQVVLALQAVLTGLAALLWLRRGWPHLLGPFAAFRLARPAGDWRYWLGLVSVSLVGLAIAYIYLRQAQLVLSIYPYNYDALTYHLSRVGYWLQYHSLFPWPTPNPRQTTFPMNAELGVLWTVLWWGTDRLSGAVQWMAVPIIMLGIVGLARVLGYSRWQAAITALLWATLAQVLYQSSSPQNDLVTAAFWVTCVYFFHAGLFGEQRAASYALSGLAFGLAIGTKGTSLMVLPGLGVAVLLTVLMLGRRPDARGYVMRWALACLLGFVAFGSYIYLQNAFVYGRILGPSTERSGAGLLQTHNGALTYAHQLRDNVGRYVYQFVDFSPLPGDLPSQINATKIAVFTPLFRWLSIPVSNPETIALQSFDLSYLNPLDENASWFGPLAILLIPAALIQAYVGVRRRDARRLGLLILGLGFLVVQSAVEAWTPYKGRYYLIPVSITFPLMACLLNPRSLGRAVLALAIVALGLVVMFTVTFDMATLKHISLRDAFAPGRKLPAWPNEFQFFMFKRNVPEDASIGLTGGLNFQDYPFFGEGFTHYLTLALPVDEALWPHINLDRFEQDFQRSDYLVLDQSRSVSISETLLQAFDLLGTDGRNSLWVRKGLRPADICDGARWPFRDFLKVSPGAAVCPQFPVTPPHKASDGAAVYIEGDRYVPVISSKPNGFLKFNLLARDATQLQLAIRVDPQGYTFPQNLELVLSHAGAEPQVYTTAFSGKGLVRLAIPLPKGVSTVQLALADSPLEVSITSIQADTP